MDNRPVAIITGCSTGIGLETSVLLAQKGYRVFATLRNLKKAVTLREKAAGLPVEILALDVDKAASVKKAVSSVVKSTGRIDVLINNAGWGAFGALEEFSDQEILAQYETNVFGLLRVTKAVLPAMRSRKSGRILQVGSLAGHMTFAGIGLYCSSKHAVEAVTESLRLELRPFNIQVGVIEPGQMNTAFKANRRKAGVFLEGKSAYQKVLSNILDYGDQQPAQGPGPQVVSWTILKALRDKRMAIRYTAGTDARWLPFLRRFIPDALFDRILRGMYSRFER